MNEWWRGAVIYQIYPRSFQDTTGNGIGDLAGITARLDHVAGLGADAVWLSPFFASPMADMGYDVSDYTAVDPLFGTLADFDALLARAHELGLKVIIDQVISHSSDRHPWFAESRADRTGPRAAWYVWADPRPDGTPPNNWLSVFGGPAWTWEPRRRQYYLHNFLSSQPDLNFHEPAVQEALVDTMRFWLDRGVDGFRLDTVNYYHHDAALRDNPPGRAKAGEAWPPGNPYDMQDHVHSKSRPENLAFIERLRALTDSYGGRAMVGEVGDRDRAIELMAEYTGGGRRLHMAYSFEMLGPEFSARHFRDRIEGFFAAAPDGWPCWSFSNHDVMRHAGRWASHGVSTDAVARQAIALLCSFPGTLGIYQGEELGQTDTDLEYRELTDPVGLRFWPDNKGRDGCRTPMAWDADAPNAGFSRARPWLPVKPPQAARAVASQGPGSVLAAYREALAFRRDMPALRGRDFAFADLPEPLLGLYRGTGQARILCVFNLSPRPASLHLTGSPRLRGPHAGRLEGAVLHLPANGFAHIEGAGT